MTAETFTPLVSDPLPAPADAVRHGAPGLPAGLLRGVPGLGHGHRLPPGRPRVGRLGRGGTAGAARDAAVAPRRCDGPRRSGSCPPEERIDRGLLLESIDEAIFLGGDAPRGRLGSAHHGRHPGQRPVLADRSRLRAVGPSRRGLPAARAGPAGGSRRRAPRPGRPARTDRSPCSTSRRPSPSCRASAN